MKTKDIITRSKAVVSVAIRAANTKEVFEKALQSKGMDVVFRTNNTGRIYGVTFIDHENKVALNGSRLGKAFSANVFNAWFNEGKKPQLFTENTAQKPVNEEKSVINYDTSTIEELSAIFDIKPQGEDYEEIAFARRMRKKKRKKFINH